MRIEKQDKVYGDFFIHSVDLHISLQLSGFDKLYLMKH